MDQPTIAPVLPAWIPIAVPLSALSAAIGAYLIAVDVLTRVS